MRPFDDSIPEESTSTYQNLVTLLRQTAPDAVSITPEEQTQMLARVRARLHQADDVSSEDTSPVRENPDAAFQPLPLRRKAPRRSSHMRHTLNMIAAVLVIGVIAGASFFLFSSHQASNLGSNIPTSAPVGPIKAPVTVRSEAGGLEASLQVTSGPYFLSELLGVDFTLTNHSQKSLFLGGGASLNSCNGAFSGTITGGGKPHYTFPVTPILSCPAPFPTALDPGKTLIGHSYMPLTSSGQVSLMVGARFFTVKKGVSGETITSGSSPLDGKWPVIHVNVITTIPADRNLSLLQQSSQVIVSAPSSARSHLVYYDMVTCGGTMSTNAAWYSLTTTTLHERGCPGANKHWIYAIGTPGYAIASGEISS